MNLFYLLSLLIISLWNTVSIAAENTSETEPLQELAEIVVKHIDDPLTIAYSELLQALDTFKEYQHLAPSAIPRFKIWQRQQQQDPDTSKLELHLVGGEVYNDVPLAADNSFALAYSQEAVEENAQLRLNRDKKTYILLADINIRNLPPNTRRLGDLRLECEMNWAFSEDINLLLRASAFALTLNGPCHTHLITVNIGYRAPKPLASATMVSGERRKPLSTDNIQRNGLIFVLPLNDSSWPDDTLIEFEYAPTSPTH